jgi:hypothetical protein
MATKPKPGSAEAKKAFYHAQRLKADKTGDTKTSTKIYDKLNAAKYSKSAAGAKNFSDKKSEYEANELTRPKDKMPAKKKNLGGHRGN